MSVLLCEPGKGAGSWFETWIAAALHICLISSRTALCLAMFAPEVLQYLRFNEDDEYTSINGYQL